MPSEHSESVLKDYENQLKPILASLTSLRDDIFDNFSDEKKFTVKQGKQSDYKTTPSSSILSNPYLP